MKKMAALKNNIFTNSFLLIIICISCNSTNTDKEIKKRNPMEGVWELSQFYHLANGDTLISNTNKVQHKIYLNG